MKNVQILIGWNRSSSAGKWETFCTLQHYSQWWLIALSLSHNCTHYFFLSRSLAESNTRPAFFNNIIRMKSNTDAFKDNNKKHYCISVQDIFTLININFCVSLWSFMLSSYPPWSSCRSKGCWFQEATYTLCLVFFDSAGFWLPLLCRIFNWVFKGSCDSTW